MKKVLLFAGLAISLAGCYNDSYDKLYPTPVTPVVCDTTTISFATDIKPIFAANCSVNNSSCHQSASSSGGINLNVWSQDLADQAATTGYLLSDINFTTNSMPKAGTKMTSCEINKISRWAHQGALNN